jgi:DNA-binding NarL/FixJ family response regulator
MVLQMRADFHVIAEAADGMEAVQAARALQPNVILLDINLPKLAESFLEVAARGLHGSA